MLKLMTPTLLVGSVIAAIAASTPADARIGIHRPGVGVGRVGSGLGFRPGVGVGRAGVGLAGWRNGPGYGGYRRYGYGAAALTGAAVGYAAGSYPYGGYGYGYPSDDYYASGYGYPDGSSDELYSYSPATYYGSSYYAAYPSYGTSYYAVYPGYGGYYGGHVLGCGIGNWRC